jgi:hypothetical protein
MMDGRMAVAEACVRGAGAVPMRASQQGWMEMEGGG